MRFLKQNYKIIIGYIGLFMILYPVLFQLFNPELTRSQIFLKFWYLNLFGVLAIFYGIIKSK